MKITDERVRPELKAFKDFEVGSALACPQTNNIYMKTKDQMGLFCMDKKFGNCVNLITGEIGHVEEETLCEVINAKLVIKNETGSVNDG